MYSINAVKAAIAHPEYTLKAAVLYPFLIKDITYIKKSISGRFPASERQRYAHGASAGIKEVVLYALVRHCKPEIMIETGVAQGVSTYFILKAMHDNGKGHLLSIDYPNRDPKGYTDEGGKQDNVYIPKGLDSGWLVPDAFKSRWKLMLGRSMDILEKIRAKKIDAFFHDSDHSYRNMMAELDWAARHVKRGGIIIADDTLRNSAWDESCAKFRWERISSPISAAKQT